MEEVRTDHGWVRKAKITLQCELKPGYYTYKNDGDYPNLTAIAEALYDINEKCLGPTAKEVIVTLDTTVPVGYRTFCHKVPHWLVVRITEPEERHQNAEWEELMTLVTAKILNRIAIKGDDCIASIEYGNERRFVVMVDNGGHEEDYITI